MNETIYSDIVLSMPYHYPGLLKEKQYAMLEKCINGSRFAYYAKVDCPGYMEFSDDQHFNARITRLESFKRGKVNCIILNIAKDNKYYTGEYDKIIVYIQEFNKTDFYAYILYNTETHKFTHVCGFEKNDGILISKMYNSLTNVYKRNLYKLYLKQTCPGMPADKFKKLKETYEDWQKTYNYMSFDHSRFTSI